MKNKRNIRIGEIRKNKQGLTMKIVKYVNNKNVTIKFVETGEEKVVRYDKFLQGMPSADLLNYPPYDDVPLKYAVVTMIAATLITLTALGGLIYWLCK